MMTVEGRGDAGSLVDVWTRRRREAALARAVAAGRERRLSSGAVQWRGSRMLVDNEDDAADGRARGRQRKLLAEALVLVRRREETASWRGR